MIFYKCNICGLITNDIFTRCPNCGVENRWTNETYIKQEESKNENDK